jgi:hypothetical protein
MRCQKPVVLIEMNSSQNEVSISGSESPSSGTVLSTFVLHFLRTHPYVPTKSQLNAKTQRPTTPCETLAYAIAWINDRVKVTDYRRNKDRLDEIQPGMRWSANQDSIWSSLNTNLSFADQTRLLPARQYDWGVNLPNRLSFHKNRGLIRWFCRPRRLPLNVV